MRLRKLNCTDISIDRHGRTAFMVVELENRWQEAPSHVNGRTFGVCPERGRLLLMLTCDVSMAEQLPGAMVGFREQLTAAKAANPSGTGTMFSLSSVNGIPRIGLPLGIDVETVHPSILARSYTEHTDMEEAARAARLARRAGEAAAKNSRLSRFDAAMARGCADPFAGAPAPSAMRQSSP